MKKQITLLLSLTFLLYNISTVSGAEIATNQIEGWPTGPDIMNLSGVLMDADTGAILYNKAMDEKRYPASTTKILTALVALEHSSLTDEVTFGETAMQDIYAGSANINRKAGEILTMEQCLYAILLASANEVSTQVAEYIGGSVEGFCEMMNQKAAQLGCTGTHFVNANGLPNDDHYTTAHDLALIMQAALKNETFCAIEANLNYTLPATNMSEPMDLYNHHPMLHKDHELYYEGAFAGKTGYTDAAGNTLVTAARRGDMTLICVVMKSANAEQITDTRNLLDYGFNNFTHLTPTGSDTEDISGMITIPNTLTQADLEYTDVTNTDSSVTRQYTYHDIAVGTAQVAYHPTEQPTEPSEVMPETTVQPTPQTATEHIGMKSDFASPNSRTLFIFVFLAVDAVGILLISIVSVRKKRHKKKKKKGKRS